MKIKALLATLIGAVAINGATAGEWCPPAPDKCPVECSPDLGGSISLGYDTDYIWKGVRLSRDTIWADVNYTFEAMCLPITVGVWHGTSLTSGAATIMGDKTDIYASVGLPEIMGVSSALTYTHYLFPTQRTPGGPNQVGDSFGSVGLSASKELFCGITAGFGSEYFLGGNPGAPGNELGAWYHHAGVGYEMDVTDCIGVELTAGVAYSDGLWSDLNAGNVGSGWNHYYVRAGIPIALNCRATLTPYVGYNGTPDGWVAGNVNQAIVPGANTQDALHGGVSIKVEF